MRPLIWAKRSDKSRLQILGLLSLRCILQEVTDPAGKAAFVWILGQYGQGIQVKFQI